MSESGVRRLDAGPEAVLVEVDSLEHVTRLYAELRRRQPAGLVDIVPAARTVLLIGPGAKRIAGELGSWSLPEAGPVPGPAVEIPVVYDGADLDHVAQHLRLSVVDVVRLHTAATFTAAFCGFVPGFAYLAGVPSTLQVPRRESPRTSVPAGAVALAGEYTGIYPRSTPGGWQLIGRTALAVWDSARDPPALLAPGTRVRFVAVPPP